MKLTGNRCRCAGCDRCFNSVGAFDKHRSGPANARLCLDPAEIGMTTNAAGFWVTRLMPLRSEPEWAGIAGRKREKRDFGEIPALSAPEPESA